MLRRLVHSLALAVRPGAAHSLPVICFLGIRFVNFCFVHLGDRGGRHGLRQCCDQVVRRRAKVVGKDLLRLADGKGRHVVLQRRKGAGHVDPDNIRPRGKELAELDIGRAKPVERVAQPLAPFVIGQPGGFQPAGKADKALRAGWQRGVVDKSARTGAGQRKRRPCKPQVGGNLHQRQARPILPYSYRSLMSDLPA